MGEELAVMGTATTLVKKAITKSLARTQATAAKKKKAKAKKAKKPKAKKAKKAKKPKKKKKKKKAKKKKKKRKKKKAKKVRFVGGKRRKGQHNGKTTRGQVFKALWAYIKKKGINKGRTVGKIDGLWNGGSMFKMTAAVSKHIK